MDLLILSVGFLIFLLINGYVGYVAWCRTKNADDYLVDGRQSHPFIMA